MLNNFKTFLHSLIGQFSTVVVFAFTLLMLGVMYDGDRVLKTAIQENVNASIKQTSQLLNLIVSTYASAGDLKTVEIFFSEWLKEDSANGLRYLLICDENGQPLVSTLNSKTKFPQPSNLEQLDQAINFGVVHVRSPILLPNQKIGYLQYGMSIKNLVDATANEKANSLLRILGILLVTLMAIFIFGKRLSKRIQDMTMASREIVAGNYQQVLVLSGSDELTALGTQFNLMAFQIHKSILEITELNLSLELRVESRTEDLAHANRLLEKNLLSLEAAQERLIQAEKLASLGSLVAGVAHELNTPIGNALTVVSTLNDKHREIKAIFHDGALKKSTFDGYIKTIEDASELLEINITRAANLISSFKTIAVNQTNEARCRFDLRRLLLALEPSIRLQLQRKKIDLQIELEQEVELDSYPGAITQIILNLHANAVVHAFEHTEAGRIRIQVSPDPGNTGRILMRFSDNGAGISKSNLSKVFDPFFTTKLGQGGSGLGLHICYNIAKNILGGHISVESNHEGTVFHIYIALIAPVQQKSLDS